MAITNEPATSAQTIENSIGVNTHIGEGGTGYASVSTTASAINYLGIKNLRDAPNASQDVGTSGLWQQIANATGAKFDAYMNRGSTASDVTDLANAKLLANQGILNLIEGVDEPDVATQYGNSSAWSANFQKTVYATAHSLGLKAVNMSFGGGWTATNNWQGDYGTVGDLSAYTDYGNAHTYPNASETVDAGITRLNGLAKLAASSRPVMTTELGWNGAQFSAATIAKYTLDAVLDGVQDGDAKSYFYGLFDDASGKYGLMNSDGSARPAGTALHNLTTILADSGTPKSGTLAMGLTDTQSSDHSLLMEKSNGTFELALWNESAGAHSVTLSLGATASAISVYDPLVSSSPTASYSNKSSVTVTVGDHPVIVQVGGSSVAPVQSSPAPTTTTQSYNVGSNQTLTITGGTNTISVNGNDATVNASAGTNKVVVNGQHDIVNGGSGVDTVTAFKGLNTVKTGAGADHVTFAGSGNIVYASAGDTLAESGSSNRIVFGAAGGTASQIFGYVLKNSDVLDLRTTLASTSWNKDPSTLSKFLKVGMSGSNAILSVDPSGVAGGATYQLAVLHDSGAVSLSSLLPHTLTT
jgi:hypothetical protein